MIDIEAALEDATKALGTGECLQAYDIAAAALEQDPDHVLLKHCKVLALARAGSSAQAKKEFERLGLDGVKSEEVLSLAARIEKDVALATSGTRRRKALARAADVYAEAFAAEGGYYPAINAASLHLLAGDVDEARSWAKIALDLAQGEHYYKIATRAEANLVLGNAEAAAKAIADAVGAPDADAASRASTRRQCLLLIDELGHHPDILKPLAPIAVLHYTGHIIAPPKAEGRFPANQEHEIAAAVEAVFRTHDIGLVVGSLAAGADIITAEVALRAGIEIHIVLPFDEDEFKSLSVAPAGADWLERFEAVKQAANAVRFVTSDSHLGDNALFGYASEYALGYCKLRASWLDSNVIQLAIWDGEPSSHGQKAGVVHDMSLVQADSNIAQIVIPVESTRKPAENAGSPGASTGDIHRINRTMVFGDFKGFSSLPDSAILGYVDDILGVVASTTDNYEDHIVFRNTWGDGLFIVFDDSGAAARCAFELQEVVRQAVASTPLAPGTLGLRIGIHYGPVYETYDPMLKRNNVFGAHVSRAARVEPITPEGEVYVTDQTAAALLLNSGEAYAADYVGRMPLAKNYGDAAMYRLRQK